MNGNTINVLCCKNCLKKSLLIVVLYYELLSSVVYFLNFTSVAYMSIKPSLSYYYYYYYCYYHYLYSSPYFYQ